MTSSATGLLASLRFSGSLASIVAISRSSSLGRCRPMMRFVTTAIAAAWIADAEALVEKHSK
jgi:hypothetical protein